jgi:AcrR family transcriptional regulator
VREHPNLLAGEELLPEPKQKRSWGKRARLKSAGLELFGELGYDATSVDDIAARAGLAVGTFYQHYRSKRQLLLSLMDELLQQLSQLNLRPQGTSDIRSSLRGMLGGAFSADLQYLGAYRAWQEAVLSDPDLARKQREIHSWTVERVTTVFKFLAQMPGARSGADVSTLAQVMDSFFWGLLGRAVQMPSVELNLWIDAATHLIYHALFTDQSEKAGIQV